MSSTASGAWVLPLAMFLGSFAWSFVFVSLPFHILAISSWDATATLRWTGWILGVSPLVTVVTAPVWGRFAERHNPKALYVLTQWLQGAGFFGMALARTLPELFLARFVLGVTGAASTFAFMGAGRAKDAREAQRQVAAIQSAMTVGQVVGPLAGAITAARLGFRASFVLGGLILLGVWCARPGRASGAGRDEGRWIGRAPRAPTRRGRRVAHRPRRIDPDLLSDRDPAPGAHGPRRARRADARDRRRHDLRRRRRRRSRLATRAQAGGADGGAAPHRHPAGGVVADDGGARRPVLGMGYGVVRFVQMLAVAPVFPIVVARIAQSAGGQAIGIINSARIGAAFLGPVLATTLLAWTSSPTVLYVLLAAAGLACLPFAKIGESSGPHGRARP
jgi:MFS family permease